MEEYKSFVISYKKLCVSNYEIRLRTSTFLNEKITFKKITEYHRNTKMFIRKYVLWRGMEPTSSLITYYKILIIF
jgi:hypothetical protein